MKRITLLFSVLIMAMPFLLNASTGEELWARHCKKCHGDTGSGDTPMGKKLEILDYSTAAAQESVTDDSIREVIINGKKAESGRLVMFAFGKKITDEEIDLLIAYFRSLKAE